MVIIFYTFICYIQIKLIKEMDLSASDNPQALIYSCISYSSIQKKNKISNGQSIFQECQSILKKSPENRFPAQNATLYKLITVNEYLKDLSQMISVEFVKGILKNAKIQFVDKKQVIVEEDQKLNYIVIVLEGKLGVQKQLFCFNSGEKKQSEAEQFKRDQLFERLTIFAKKQRDSMRKQSKLQRKTSIPTSNYEFIPPLLSDSDFKISLNKIQRTITQNEDFGAKEILSAKTYPNKVVALQKSTLLVIEITFLFYYLEVAFKTKVGKNMELMRNIPAFNILEDDKLSEIIINLKEMKRKKNDIIYEQGETANDLFLLIQGEIKINKEAHLFMENPNDLYTDRRKLIHNKYDQQKQRTSKSSKQSKNEDILPYANLTTLYNYRPIKKNIEIGVISSFGIFGEEQLVYSIPRQTKAFVSGQEAKYYQIPYRKILQIIGVKNIDKFKEVLQASISKKILYRQKQYAEKIQIQNKTNLDYFYYDGRKTKQSPRRLRLQKINERLFPKVQIKNQNEMKAFYTTFNFDKMLSKRYSEPKQVKNKKTTHQSSTDSISKMEFNEAQQKIVGISHSWKPIQKKVNQQQIVSLKISPQKHQININQPLIDQMYFRQIAKEQRRINKQGRILKLSLGKRIK